MMPDENITAACKKVLSEAEENQEVTVLIQTKLDRLGDEEARRAVDLLQQEQLATRRAQLLARIHERYGQGRSFRQNLRDSREKAQERVARAAPRPVKLWLGDAIAVTGTRKDIEDLANHEDVERVDWNPTFRIPEVLQTPLEDTPEAIDGSAWGLAKIRATEVWGGYGRGEGVCVGHLDTGVDPTHPALEGKIKAFQEFDGLGNAVVSAPHDSGLHGTHTAGTICGQNFRGLNIGVAPRAELASALVLPGGGGSFAQIIAGMQWTVDQDADVINLSLGANGYFPIWNIPIFNATLSGVLVVASVGNSGHGTSGGPGNDFLALGVGATHYEDAVGGFSGGATLVGVIHQVLSPIFGPLTYIKPDLGAPGVQVLSAVPGPDLAALNGTSMASPHVAGAAALVLSAAPGLENEPLAIRSILLGTIEDLGEAGKNQRYGFGRLDVLAAAQTAVSTTAAAVGAAAAGAGGSP